MPRWPGIRSLAVLVRARAIADGGQEARGDFLPWTHTIRSKNQRSSRMNAGAGKRKFTATNPSNRTVRSPSRVPETRPELILSSKKKMFAEIHETTANEGWTSSRRSGREGSGSRRSSGTTSERYRVPRTFLRAGAGARARAGGELTPVPTHHSSTRRSYWPKQSRNQRLWKRRNWHEERRKAARRTKLRGESSPPFRREVRSADLDADHPFPAIDLL